MVSCKVSFNPLTFLSCFFLVFWETDLTAYLKNIEQLFDDSTTEATRNIQSTDLVKHLPAQVPSQQAVQRLLVPAQRHPAEMLLEAELRALQAGL